MHMMKECCVWSWTESTPSYKESDLDWLVGNVDEFKRPSTKINQAHSEQITTCATHPLQGNGCVAHAE
ncbi:hypothetical protein IF1G_00935 [Cordyceps javanica]|uniref:Uncharacterized protein n=1 Tax=Cordyceps javanica TaxID=43265 RepID=A0A545VH00_9HYPO|nr:hypothetical protein IF1G_00935 [Cordyceps javanica]